MAGCFDCLTELTGLISAQGAELSQLGGAEGRAGAELRSLMIGLEKDCDTLRQAALSEAWQVQRSPQVCAAAAAAGLSTVYQQPVVHPTL